MCPQLAGDYMGEGRISWPAGWDLQLWRLFSSPRAGLEFTLPPCSPQENGGEPRSHSVSESPDSPTALAVSPNSSETHGEVGLGMLGGGAGWKADLG